MILARGDGWAVIAKPPRLLVHRNEFAPRADALLQRARGLLGTHVHLVHRLDFQASGCVLVATDPATTARLQAAMTGARKRYVALVRGERRIAGPVVVDTPMKNADGALRDARSVVWTLGTSADPRCSLLLAEPHTGRFHQVRRHVRDLGHPIVGDTKHGDSHVNAAFRGAWGIDRLALHCLSIDIPEVGIAATCPLFADHAAAFQRMPWWDVAAAACPDLALHALPLDPAREAA